MVTEGWEFMKIKGIPLRVHPSWFVIVLLFTWTSQGQVVRASSSTLPIWISWGIGFVTALLLFLSVLLHELGHSFVALNEGVKVRSITLFLLGGVARVEKECPTPMGALRVAAAGPTVSLLIAIVLLNSIGLASDINPLLGNLCGQIGSLNLILGLFNLLPGLPLDGGLILKALVWNFTGSQRKGIQVATNSGRLLSSLAIFIGVLILLKGGGISGLWMMMLGWFGLTSSRSQSQMLALQKILSKSSVSETNSRRFRVLEADQSLKSLSELRLSKDDKEALPEWVLVCHSGRWLGYVTDEPLKKLPVQQWEKHSLFEYIKPLEELPSIGEKTFLWMAVIELEKSKDGRLLVLNLAGLPSGVLDRTSLGHAVLKKLGLRIPPQILEISKAQNSYPLSIALPRIVDGMISSGIVDYEEKTF